MSWTPASVTRVRLRSTTCRCISLYRCGSPASVTWVLLSVRYSRPDKLATMARSVSVTREPSNSTQFANECSTPQESAKRPIGRVPHFLIQFGAEIGTLHHTVADSSTHRQDLRDDTAFLGNPPHSVAQPAKSNAGNQHQDQQGSHTVLIPARLRSRRTGIVHSQPRKVKAQT